MSRQASQPTSASVPMTRSQRSRRQTGVHSLTRLSIPGQGRAGWGGAGEEREDGEVAALEDGGGGQAEGRGVVRRTEYESKIYLQVGAGSEVTPMWLSPAQPAASTGNHQGPRATHGLRQACPMPRFGPLAMEQAFSIQVAERKNASRTWFGDKTGNGPRTHYETLHFEKLCTYCSLFQQKLHTIRPRLLKPGTVSLSRFQVADRGWLSRMQPMR
jgi:hypothetical protein